MRNKKIIYIIVISIVFLVWLSVSAQNSKTKFENFVLKEQNKMLESFLEQIKGLSILRNIEKLANELDKEPETAEDSTKESEV